MNPRYRAREIISQRPPISGKDTKRPAEIFGENTFDLQTMREYLSRDIFDQLSLIIEEGRTLERSIATPVASAMRLWAIDRGATNYTHWYQPLTGHAAEKHESFLDMHGQKALEKFSGDELSQRDPEPTAFPSGGSRSSFEARGYTAWDCTSPAFILETTYGKTLCIPSIYISYNGLSRDYKLPLIRSMKLLDKAAVGLCTLFDPNIKKVFPTLGVEQEFFLIDRAWTDLRPDILLTGRTLFGAPSPRNLPRKRSYFGGIPERVFAFFDELEKACLKVGVPLKTRHNEFVPAQFECALKFEPVNVAVDHSLILMDIIHRIARKHDFTALLHEKPFQGISGSGKHNNWSMMTNTGKNLLAPGRDPEENLLFLAFFTSVISAVANYGDLFLASLVSEGNDLRLGNNDAPPPSMSIFIGRKLTAVLEKIESPPRKKKLEELSEHMKLGIQAIPELLVDDVDQNRTAPFAFSANRFEIRSVGARANSAEAMSILNTIVAHQLTDLRTKIEGKMNRGRPLNAALLDMIKENIRVAKPMLYVGENHPAPYRKMSDQKGSFIAENTPLALQSFLSHKAKMLFKDTHLFIVEEVRARNEVKLVSYVETLRTETKILKELIRSHVLPLANQFQATIVKNLPNYEGNFELNQGNYLEATTGKIKTLTEDLFEGLGKLEELVEQAESFEDLLGRASYYAEKVRPFLGLLGENINELEHWIPDDMWSLPKYREMLFVS